MRLNMRNIFKYEYIYLSKLLKASDNFFSIVLNQIYSTLKDAYDGNNTLENLKTLEKYYPHLIKRFIDWFNNFSKASTKNNLKNKKLFDINIANDYYLSIIMYISGMTDKFAIDMYNEIIGF